MNKNMVSFGRAGRVILVIVVAVMASTITNGTRIGDTIKDAVAPIGSKAKEIGNTTVEAAKTAGNTTVEAAKTAGNKTVEAAKTAGNKTVEAAKTVGSKLPGAKSSGASCDVKAKGAKGDGKTDDSAAFMSAWKDVCGVGGTFIVPKGDYLVNCLELTGPCKGPITMEMNGNLKAPAAVTTRKSHSGWIEIQKLTDFTLNGNGAIFDGQGAQAWKVNDCQKTGNCNNLPINIRLDCLTNAKIKSIKSVNSKLVHIKIHSCKNVILEDIGIEAPAESLNTDGINVGRSDGVTINGAQIKTGDDCISVSHGTKNLVVENSSCGPGHGFSIGSLGKYPHEEPVSGVTIKNCTMANTDNGVRIKTWPGCPPGSVSNVLFQDITMDNVTNPILIDQVYCPHGKCQSSAPSKIKCSDIKIKGIKGTSASKVAVKLLCSTATPCTNVALADINLVSKSKEGPAVSACCNVKPVLTGGMIPAACTEVAKPGP